MSTSRALHDAGVDEDDFTRQSFANADAVVNEPLVDDQVLDFGLVGEEAQD